MEDVMDVRRTIAASLIGMLLIPAAGRAQTMPARGALRKSIQREAVRLASAQKAAGQPPQQQPPHRSWAARHPIALGAILGIVTGGTVSQISDGRVTNSDGRPVFLMGAVPGLVIGSSIGAIVAFTQD
jgi:hypothetical protein